MHVICGSTPQSFIYRFFAAKQPIHAPAEYKHTHTHRHIHIHRYRYLYKYVYTNKCRVDLRAYVHTNICKGVRVLITNAYGNTPTTSGKCLSVFLIQVVYSKALKLAGSFHTTYILKYICI